MFFMKSYGQKFNEKPFCSEFVQNLAMILLQVSKLGCRAFALLFDDINPTLKPSDAVVYKSSAQAQASLTNELFTYLKKPRFLFCPTGKLSFNESYFVIFF